jgi:hypothetical protein
VQEIVDDAGLPGSKRGAGGPGAEFTIDRHLRAIEITGPVSTGRGRIEAPVGRIEPHHAGHREATVLDQDTSHLVE